MGQARFYSLALGKEKNFQAETNGLVKSLTPDVYKNSLLYNDSADAVAITNLTNGGEGQVVVIKNVGTGALTLSGSNFYLSDSSTLTQNDNITVINHSNKWYEVGRSHAGATYFGLHATNASSLDVTNKRLLVYTFASAMTIKGISGGYDGQVVTILNAKSDLTLSIGNAYFCGKTAGSYLLSASDAVSLIRYNSQWFAVGDAATGI